MTKWDIILNYSMISDPWGECYKRPTCEEAHCDCKMLTPLFSQLSSNITIKINQSYDKCNHVTNYIRSYHQFIDENVM